MNHKLLFLAFVALLFSGCHRTTLEDLAAKTAEDYTERYCPTPVENCQRTDSVTFPVKHIRLVIIIPCQASWMILPS